MDLSCQSPQQLRDKEWIITNGLGGYASTSLLNQNTRKYHGLLVSDIEGVGRTVLLSTLEEKLTVNNQVYYLSAMAFKGQENPPYHHDLRFFDENGEIVIEYRLPMGRLIKRIMMPYESNELYVDYEFYGDFNGELHIRPLFALRNFHELNYAPQATAELNHGVVKIIGEVMPSQNNPSKSVELYLSSQPQLDWYPNACQYENVYYHQEAMRGYGCHETLASLGYFVAPLKTGTTRFIWHIGVNKPCSPALLRTSYQQLLHRHPLCTQQHSMLTRLKQAGEKCVIKRGDHYAVLAGYHWFESWGRDTFIALPDLLLKNEPVYADVLDGYLKERKDGLIPNFLDKDGKHAFNSIDASLWWSWALSEWYQHSPNKLQIAQKYVQPLKEIFSTYQKGLDNNDIYWRCDDGLIYAGNAVMNLTWMDAKVAGVAVTPRYGYVIEINALWYNLVTLLINMLQRLPQQNTQEISLLLGFKKQIKERFNEVLVHKNGVYDFVNENECNTQIRCNQIIATGLATDLLSHSTRIQIMSEVEAHLLTPYGLRTLSPQDKDYIAHYEGDQATRDLSYHNGTVWSWLWIFYMRSLHKQNHISPQQKLYIQQAQQAMTQHLQEAGIYGVSEIFDADHPYKPKGTILQAWSVASCIALFDN